MKVYAKGFCPICNSAGKCISFHIKAQEFALLTFWCRSCKLTFKAQALGYKIGKGEIEFLNVTISSEIIWYSKDFNPSER